MINTYEKAYTEILEILKYLPEEEYNKIPKEKIEFYEKNKDEEYVYIFDSSIELNKQPMLTETRAIIVTLFRDFFATNDQKEKLNVILNQNERLYEEKLREKYNPDDIFKKQQNNNEIKKEETALVEVKQEKWYKKIITFIKNIIKK